MAQSSNRVDFQQLRALFDVGTCAGLTDGELLDRFLDRGGEAAELAFAALVERHGPMVLRVCRRILRDPADAEDAFQAVFLVLARRAGSVRKRESLASWLHGVALRVAGAARSARSRRMRHERIAAEQRGVVTHREWAPDDVAAVLHGEIGRLPDRYRAAVVLCYLEGRTYDEAAQTLGCPVGTIKSRLATARRMLGVRLARRSILPLASAVAGVLTVEASAANIPRGLAELTVRLASRVGTGKVALRGAIPAAIAALTEGAMPMIGWTKLRLALVVLLVAGFGGAGAVVVAQGPGARKDPKPVDAVEVPAADDTTSVKPGADAIAPATTSPRGVAAIKKQLRGKVDLNFDGASLDEVAKSLSDSTGIPFVIDHEVVDRRKFSAGGRVTLGVQNIPLDSAIALILRPLKLTYAVIPDAVVFKIPHPAEMQTQTYYVADLLPSRFNANHVHGADRATMVDMMPIIDVLTSCVAPGTWSIHSPGPAPHGVSKNGTEPIGSIAPFFVSCSLIIRHTAEVHEEIGSRLRQLRLMRYGRESVEGTRSGAIPSIVYGASEKPAIALGGAMRQDRVYVPDLKAANVDRQAGLYLREGVMKSLERITPLKVSAQPEDADYILEWSLVPRARSDSSGR